MYRKTCIIVALAAILFASVILLTPGAKGKVVRINSKDLQEHGVRLISPTSPVYPIEIDKQKDGKAQETKDAIERMRNFSVFLKNEAEQPIVAFGLKWEITRSDGQTVTYFASFANADALSGADPSGEPNILPGNTRFLALVPEASDGGIGNTPDFHNGVVDIERQLQEATDLTVTIDNAIFANGETVGHDSQGQAARLQALMWARNDLLRGALKSIRRGIPIEDVMAKIKAISDSDTKLPTAGGSATYSYYRREFAAEIIRMRQATGDDKTTLWNAFQPLTRKWPKLHRKK